MGLIIIIVGVLLMVKGAGLILMPRKMVHFAQKMLSGKQAKNLGWIPIVVGLLLCISANFSYMALGIFLLGLLIIAKGVYILVVPIEQIKKHKWFALSDGIYRVMGIVSLVIGMLLINAAM